MTTTLTVALFLAAIVIGAVCLACAWIAEPEAADREEI